MKHVFWIHSHITYIISKETVRFLELQDKEVLFLLFRNYKLPERRFNYQRIPTSHKLNKEELIDFKIHWKKILHTEFIAYVPQTSEKRLYELVNFEHCKGFNYIEEGLLSYKEYTPSIKTKIHSVMTALTLRQRMRIIEYTHPKFQTAYCLHKNAFPKCHNKVVLDVQFSNESVPTMTNILVFDAIVSYGMTSLDTFNSLIKTVIIPHMKRHDIKDVYYKFHPQQLESKNKEELIGINRLFEQHPEIKFSEIPPELMLENVFFTTDDLVVYTFLSSLGMYAKLSDHEVFSVSDRLNISLDKNLTEGWIQI